MAHSLGCLIVAHWSYLYRKNTGEIQSALLVAPPDVEK
ncbi:MAG: alpha/beta hydrolase [Smithella sp.]